MVTSELTGEVSMGVLLVFLVFWRRGRYIGPDQQGDRQCLRLRPTFFDADFCSGSVWELSWGAKSLRTASAENVGNPLNHSLAFKYEFVLWGD